MYVHNMFEDYARSRRRGESLPVQTGNIYFHNGELFVNVGFKDTKKEAYAKARKIKKSGSSVLIRKRPYFYTIYKSNKTVQNPTIKYINE